MSDTPKRIRRERTRGWRLPPDTVVVTRPTAWGNPFKVGHRYAEGDSFLRHYGHLLDDGEVTEANCLPLFEEYCRKVVALNPDWLAPLRGKDLACWCPLSSLCHADILLRLIAERYNDAE